MGKFLNSVKEQNQFIFATKEKYFVDKTKLIDKLNERVNKLERFICITRPRRFGKSINSYMLGSYYSNNLDTKDVFDKLNIARCPSYEEHLNKHNVIYISFDVQVDEFKTYDEYIGYFKGFLKKDLKEYYPDVPDDMFVVDMIEYIYDKTKEGFIFIIDEWDYIFNNEMYTKSDRENFLRFLKSLLKDKAYVKLAYMTGILPVAKYSSGSSINMFKEYDAIEDGIYDNYFGFLREEVEKLCEKQNKISLDELQDWYNGYYTDEGERIYNPRSVVYALQDGKLKSYWTTTGRKKEIEYWINLDVKGLKKDIIDMLGGNAVGIKLLGYDAESKQEVDSRNLALSAMTILGFLSYYNGEVRIPNRELMIEFRQMVATSNETAFKEIVKNSEDILQATLDQNEEKLARLIEDTHNTYNSYFEYGTENALSCVIAVGYLAARDEYTIKREDVSAKGRADFAFYPNKINNTAFIIELKKDDTPEDAIEQIKERKYFIPFKNFTGKKLLVGITYDTKNKKHSVKIEEI